MSISKDNSEKQLNHSDEEEKQGKYDDDFGAYLYTNPGNMSKLFKSSI